MGAAADSTPSVSAEPSSTSASSSTKTDIIEARRHFAGRASDAVRAWSQRPSGQLIVGCLVVATMLAVAGAAGAFVVPRAAPRGAPPTSSAPEQPVVPDSPAATAEPVIPGASVPSDLTASGVPRSGERPADVLAAWAIPLGSKIGIPAVAMQAYGYAELVAARNYPGCRLSWTTLAGIGKVESDHGRANGARLNPDGKALPSIIGAPLDGQSGRMSIQDTDGGQIDTDRSWDRAVGPMQFIPSTWKQYAIDADGDGLPDINDIDDAALAAANYLCADNRDLSTPAGWNTAIRSYNDVGPYVDAVFNATNDYGRRSRT